VAGTKRGTSEPAVDGRRKVVGARVRVVARRGYIVEGICLDAWDLRNGGVALKIKPSDGAAPREVTTLLPVTVLSDAGADIR
jgi:hypothetical protein